MRPLGTEYAPGMSQRAMDRIDTLDLLASWLDDRARNAKALGLRCDLERAEAAAVRWAVRRLLDLWPAPAPIGPEADDDGPG